MLPASHCVLAGRVHQNPGLRLGVVGVIGFASAKCQQRTQRFGITADAQYTLWHTKRRWALKTASGFVEYYRAKKAVCG
ncbi:hypothetical protein [Paraburkholderia sp.]|uniref:hypothetical protein n=1 Tax=Paraburkholderia sp. TaxID=1926495 RepID=UPI002D5286FE|nr:hypothetical protein [Paraburkholderia sp.]HZZ03833.1 hypothetical protein [Paraburkholderia sp.]